MLKKILPVILFLLTQQSFSQNYKISWSEQLKLKKGSGSIDIIGADNTGYYFTESRKESGFHFSGPRLSYKLIKFSKDFEQQWDEDYDRELRGLDFISLQPLNNEVYIFASDYKKKERAYKVFGSKIDKTSGKLLTGEFIELGTYPIESKRENFDAKLSKMKTGKDFLLVSDLTGKDHTTLAATVLDENLKQKSNTNINLSYEPGFYTLQDVKMVGNRIVLLGRSFEEVEIKKRKKRKVFKNFVLDIYDIDGKAIKSVALNQDDNFTLEGKLLELENNEVALAGFYSKDGKKKTLNGFFIDKINVANGELSVRSSKDINTSMIGQNYSEDDDKADDDDKKDEKKDAKKKDDDDDEQELKNEYTIKSVDVNPLDGSIMIAAEISDVRISTFSSYSPGFNGSSGSWTYYTYFKYSNKDILLIGADKAGAIRWLNIVPKKQYESSRVGGYGEYGDAYAYRSYFTQAGGLPYYSSFKSGFIKDKYIVLYNDNKKNENPAAYGDKVKTIVDFRSRGEMFGLSIDMTTGKMVKKPISACSDDDVITMPRHSFILENNLIIPAWRERALGKTIMKIAKVTVNSQ